MKNNHSLERTLQNIEKKIDRFGEMPIEELSTILERTIKGDKTNRLIVFFCMLSAYVGDEQFNVMLNAPSSAGKSYIPLEIMKLFPPEDVQDLAHASPQAFFHEKGVYDKEKNTTIIDLAHKILIFLDMPHTELLSRLRPLLSHDKNVLEVKISDRNTKGGNRTKTVQIKGYPAVLFCSANLKYDEQESTRFITLSPEQSQEKIQNAFNERILKDSNRKQYDEELSKDTKRSYLMQRINALKKLNVSHIALKHEDQKYLKGEFQNSMGHLQLRSTRDIGRIISLAKVIAFFNYWTRERSGQLIYIKRSDLDLALHIWSEIGDCQIMGISPYAYDIYKFIILPTYNKRVAEQDDIFDLNNDEFGLERKEIEIAFYSFYKRTLPRHQYDSVISSLETASLVEKRRHPNNGRTHIIIPLAR